MKLNREKQQVLADIVLRVLARGICAVSLLDKRVTAEIDKLGDGFHFTLYAGTGESSPAIRLKTENRRFIRAHLADDAHDGPGVTIRFKDVSGAVPVLLGKTGVEAAFAQHRMLIFGDIGQAVSLTRVIGITRAYLFPKFIIKKSTRSVPKKRVPRFLVYIMLLFLGAPRGATRVYAENEKIPEGEGESAGGELGAAK